MDREVISAKLETLRRCVQRIKDKTPASAAVLLEDYDLQDIICMGDNTFAKEEAHSEFMVVTRGTHNHSKALVVDTHFKGLLNSEGVLALL